jgi:hypothetical protein
MITFEVDEVNKSQDEENIDNAKEKGAMGAGEVENANVMVVDVGTHGRQIDGKQQKTGVEVKSDGLANANPDETPTKPRKGTFKRISRIIDGKKEDDRRREKKRGSEDMEVDVEGGLKKNKVQKKEMAKTNTNTMEAGLSEQSHGSQ